jgi:plastocyanin
VQLKAGGSLTWSNKGSTAHGAESQDGTWRTAVISKDSSDSVRFEKPGVYVYVCPQHPWTIGEVLVTP